MVRIPAALHCLKNWKEVIYSNSTTISLPVVQEQKIDEFLCQLLAEPHSACPQPPSIVLLEVGVEDLREWGLCQTFPLHHHNMFRFARSVRCHSHHLIQLTIRWWSADSWASLFINHYYRVQQKGSKNTDTCNWDFYEHLHHVNAETFEGSCLSMWETNSAQFLLMPTPFFSVVHHVSSWLQFLIRFHWMLCMLTCSSDNYYYHFSTDKS